MANKQRFKPLEKLEEKHLQEDDDIESLDLSINFGPATFEEAERNPVECSSSGEKSVRKLQGRSSSKKRYMPVHTDSNSGQIDHIQNIPKTQRITPKKNFSKSSIKKRRRTPDLGKNSSSKSRKNTILQQKPSSLQKKHSLGFPVKYSNDPNEMTEGSEDLTIFPRHHNIHNNYQAPVKIVRLNSPGMSSKRDSSRAMSAQNKPRGRKVSASPRIRIPSRGKNIAKEAKL